MTDLTQIFWFWAPASAVLIAIVITANALVSVYLERKVSAWMQNRLGPMENGPQGIFQTAIDAVKLLLKEDIIARGIDRPLFKLAPYIVFAASFAVFAVVPLARGISPADLDVGAFYVLAVSSFVVAGIMMAGWSSNNKWSLYGAMRGVAQAVSYEIPLSLAVLAVVMAAGSMSLQTICAAQEGGFWNWNGLALHRNPFLVAGFLVYFVASLAEVNRTPFDLPEAESELVGGYHTEYSGMRFALFFLAEYANMLAVGVLATVLFLGGWQPALPFLDFIPGPLWLFGKAYLFVLLQIWIRMTLPRLRVDQLMHVCWKVLVPAALCILVLGALWELVIA
ncbi:MAG: NADH-quinone oxidoreductase subunit NuoH [bacterium]|jgi:NADH-quinone oxidoreductase subunit H|nr:NADH-quinone oxidoreductase subunit NuoH [bacterium]